MSSYWLDAIRKITVTKNATFKDVNDFSTRGESLTCFLEQSYDVYGQQLTVKKLIKDAVREQRQCKVRLNMCGDFGLICEEERIKIVKNHQYGQDKFKEWLLENVFSTSASDDRVHVHYEHLVLYGYVEICWARRVSPDDSDINDKTTCVFAEWELQMHKVEDIVDDDVVADENWQKFKKPKLEKE